ncbi:MAG: DUF4935 domain-containing protein [Plectolyngbya sp. WJT66-NPBG17]|nr:DUF4935 domain-containing protein [Plectolyngbya sp. WJT66-NPBG17]
MEDLARKQLLFRVISMRDLFAWRLQPSEAEFSKLWENAIFVFDTNFLLDLYRVSHSTADDFLSILERLQDRIWLPYQVADEFFRNREKVIETEVNAFKEALSVVAAWESEQQAFNTLRGRLGQPGKIVAAEVKSLFSKQQGYCDAVKETADSFREKIKQIADAHSSLNADEDRILETLFSLFDTKVGEPYDASTLQKLYKEGMTGTSS